MNFEIISSGLLCLSLSWANGLIVAIGLDWAGPDAPAGPGPVSAHGRVLAEALARYVAGEPVDWPELPLYLEGLSGFRRTVLLTLAREVGHGRVTTYGGLAAMAGRPGAARAVGRVMATNPWSMVFP